MFLEERTLGLDGRYVSAREDIAVDGMYLSIQYCPYFREDAPERPRSKEHSGLFGALERLRVSRNDVVAHPKGNDASPASVRADQLDALASVVLDTLVQLELLVERLRRMGMEESLVQRCRGSIDEARTFVGPVRSGELPRSDRAVLAAFKESLSFAKKDLESAVAEGTANVAQAINRAEAALDVIAGRVASVGDQVGAMHADLSVKISQLAPSSRVLLEEKALMQVQRAEQAVAVVFLPDVQDWKTRRRLVGDVSGEAPDDDDVAWFATKRRGNGSKWGLLDEAFPSSYTREVGESIVLFLFRGPTCQSVLSEDPLKLHSLRQLKRLEQVFFVDFQETDPCEWREVAGEHGLNTPKILLSPSSEPFKDRLQSITTAVDPLAFLCLGGKHAVVPPSPDFVSIGRRCARVPADHPSGWLSLRSSILSHFSEARSRSGLLAVSIEFGVKSLECLFSALGIFSDHKGSERLTLLVSDDALPIDQELDPIVVGYIPGSSVADIPLLAHVNVAPLGSDLPLVTRGEGGSDVVVSGGHPLHRLAVERVVNFRSKSELTDEDRAVVAGNADSRHSDCFGSSALHAAARAGDFALTQALLTLGNGSRQLDSKGRVPADVCVDRETREVLLIARDTQAPTATLARSRTDETLTREIEDTPAYHPTQYHAPPATHPTIPVATLGVVIHEDSAGPLSEACKNGDADLVKMLLDRGANVEKASDDAQTPLMIACLNGHRDIVKMLVLAGANVNRALKGGTTPLYIACDKGRKEVVEVLLGCGADKNQVVSGGATPLYVACLNGHKEIVELLLQAGADKNKAEDDGWTPLRIACQMGHEEVVKLLLEAKADRSKAANDGRKPRDIAGSKGFVGIVKLLDQPAEPAAIKDQRRGVKRDLDDNPISTRAPSDDEDLCLATGCVPGDFGELLKEGGLGETPGEHSKFGITLGEPGKIRFEKRDRADGSDLLAPHQKAFLALENGMTLAEVEEATAALEVAKQVIFSGGASTGKAFFALSLAKQIVAGSASDVVDLDMAPPFTAQSLLRLVDFLRRPQPTPDRRQVVVLKHADQCDLPRLLGEIMHALSRRDKPVRLLPASTGTPADGEEIDLTVHANVYVVVLANPEASGSFDIVPGLAHFGLVDFPTAATNEGIKAIEDRLRRWMALKGFDQDDKVENDGLWEHLAQANRDLKDAKVKATFGHAGFFLEASDVNGYGNKFTQRFSSLRGRFNAMLQGKRN